MNRLFSIVTFVVAAFVACFGWMRSAHKADARPPVNQATVFAENLFKAIGRQIALAFVRFQLALDRFVGMRSPVFGLGITADEQILKGLSDLGDRFKKFDGVAEEMKVMKEDQSKLTTALTDVQKQLIAFQKERINAAGSNVRRSHDGISELTSRYLGGLYLLAEVEQRGKEMSSGKLELYRSEIKSILNIDIQAKTALTSSDIPLPVAYSGDVVELVYQYGLARKVGTVLPLGGASFKLPKLATSPTFGLIAASGTVSEKSPQTAWVTFTPEKFGGLIRMPSEIEEDSIVGMGQFLARYCARQMAQVEDYNFFRSTGAASGQDGTAEGLTKSVVTDSKFIYNGGASNSGKTKPSDATLADFRSLRATPSGAVLGRAKYYVHPTYEQLFASYNTSATVVPYIAAGANGPTLDGFPIVWVPDMPTYSTSATVSVVHALFGDASFNYLGVRSNMRFDLSREAGFTTDEVLVRALERFTIGKTATDCVAGLRCSAT